MKSKREPKEANTLPTVPEQPAGTIHRSIYLLRTALEELNGRMPLREIEKLAIMINQAMTVGARSFHTPEHVFDLVESGHPHRTLAALFHDLVYFQVDQGFLPEIAETVRPCVEARNGELWLRADAGGRQLELCSAVFGFQPGDKLPPFGGMNEFLSALVMNRRLSEAVREKDLVLSTACIEATIPFRATDASGLSPAEQLAGRLQEANRKMALGLSDGEVLQAVEWAVAFANRDVANFAEKDVTRFLDNTWKLLPETNPSIRTQGVYSIRSYRIALQKMEGFLRTLDPGTIFAQYRNVPPAGELQGLQGRAERNVITAREYLGIKLLTAAILEAMAEITGGDAPVSLFMGDIDARQKGSKLEDYLPDSRPKSTARIDETLHDLLAHGRASASSFDLQNSPLSLFIYLHLGADGFTDLLGAARRMFEGSLAPREFLDALPVPMTSAIAEGCARMAFTRRDELLAYAASTRK
jgi:hypothetical protein